MYKKESFLNNYSQQNGVYILSEVNDVFESSYLEVRKKEKRIYSDDELKTLPFATSNNPHVDEWKVRVKSFLRFKEYAKSKKDKMEILDLGCGNGWFCGQLAKTSVHNFYGVDVNLKELEQAERIFNSDKTNFIYADIFTAQLPNSMFNIITTNAVVQYFSDLGKLIEKLFNLLVNDGEIHIIDSPFYDSNDIGSARKRSEEYYDALGFPKMSKNYFHHSFDELSAYKYDILFDPQSTYNKLRKLFLHKDSPFPWVRIKK